MLSLRTELATASDRKLMPQFAAPSTRDLGLKLGLSIPISVRDLIDHLRALPSRSVVRSSGLLGPSTTTGSADVGFTSDGLCAFRGHVRESGFIGHNYTFVMAFPEIVDSGGRALVFAHQGEVGGSNPVDPLSQESNWQINGPNDPAVKQLLFDKWDVLGKTRLEARLHVSTDVLSVLSVVRLLGVVADFVLIEPALGLVCTFDVVVGNEEQGGGLGLTCGKEF